MTLLSGPNISGNEWQYVKDCLDTGWVSSVGSYVNKFEEMIAEQSGSSYAIATSSGTTALHISLLLSGICSSDYVIVPNITFIASLNAIKYTGADPILLDIDSKTWQLDVHLLESFLENKTYFKNGICRYKEDNRKIRAIMPVHVLGNMCNMQSIMSIAEKYNLLVVEDATEALGSYYQGKHSGSFGLFGCFSFNGNKIITKGGGGMIVTNNQTLAKKAKHLTTQAKSDSFEYIHDEIGYNYRLVNILAAVGVAQMELLPSFISKKKEINRFYIESLTGIGDIQFQEVTELADINHWLFTIRTHKQKELLKQLNENGFQSRPFWVPMNQLGMFSKDIYVNDADCSNTIYQQCLSIPCSTNISNSELDGVVKIIKGCY
jgi:perosamine synthetase